MHVDISILSAPRATRTAQLDYACTTIKGEAPNLSDNNDVSRILSK